MTFKLHSPFPLLVLAALPILAPLEVFADDPFDMNVVLEAWDHRGKSISEFEATYDIQRVEMFHDKDAWIANNLEQQITVSYTPQKRAYRFSSEVRERSDSVPHSFTAVYDGELYKTLTSGDLEGLRPSASTPMGHIARGSGPGDQLTRAEHQVALWLWIEPVQFLATQVISADKLKKGEEFTQRGERVMELRATRDDVVVGGIAFDGSDWEAVLHVQPSHGYLPIKWELRYHDILTTEVQIEYLLHDDGTHYVSGWQTSQFSRTGELKSRMQATISDVKLNSPISETFDLKFPPGTQYYEDTDQGPVCFVVGDGGEVASISEAEFGAVSPADLLSHNLAARRWKVLIGIFVFVAILAVAMGARIIAHSRQARLAR